MSDAYQQFLATKRLEDRPSGITNSVAFSPQLFPFQRDVVSWALRRGRTAIFADCGLGKSFMQLEWARHLPGEVLILAPLAVAQQTVAEATRFGIRAAYATRPADITASITVTNYERVEAFDLSQFCGVVLDESSILKSFDGVTRTHLIEWCAKTPFRLCCTATPAPNDTMELGNHSEFLGIMTRAEMLAMFFVHDGGETQVWRLKRHAREAFWRWVCSWAVMFRSPADVGYPDEAFTLPPRRYHAVSVNVETPTSGQLFAMEAQSLSERIAARRETVTARAEACAALVKQRGGRWLIWCHLNSESAQVKALIPSAVEVTGSDPLDVKHERLLAFANGTIPVLVSKPSIAGFGLNLQTCHQMAFVGLSDSYEELYQAVRRCWRFGQTHPVDVYLLSATTEGAVKTNVQRKDREAHQMAEELCHTMRTHSTLTTDGTTQRQVTPHQTDRCAGSQWEMQLGDCVEALHAIDAGSIHYSLFSPPFASLYTYSNSERDLGNAQSQEQFFTHFRFVVEQLRRVLMPGRLLSIHCMNLPTSKVRDGVIGLTDFRGKIIQLCVSQDLIYHSEVVIWKDPVTAMQRTKAIGLLHKQLKKDSCLSRQGIPDYLVTFRVPGDNPERVTHTNTSFPVSLWQRYASPVWMDIHPTKTLQYRSAREQADERHICPLQLEVIERAVTLWTNPGDVGLSPFAGIGSEGVVSVSMGRRFVGMELKRSYYEQACRNLLHAAEESQRLELFQEEASPA